MGSHRGFALLEVLIAAALLVALAAGSSAIVAAAVREGHASRLRAVAATAAAAKVEELRSMDIGDVGSGEDYLDAGGLSLGSTPGAPAQAVYLRRWIVRANAVDPDVLTLDVRVATREGVVRARLVAIRAER